MRKENLGLLLLLGMFIFLPGGVEGQVAEGETGAILQRAAEEYRIGHFGQVIGLLEGEAGRWVPALRYQAYRLLALTYLACDRMVECREAVHLMLKAEPYYTPSLADPLRFVELVKEMQTGEITLVTASQQSESPDEAPVPVTLITEEMLKAIGARTLKDALLAYVPGMNSVESANEVNVAMHGIFSAGQQKILIMLDGHRLNSRSTNGAAPDYSMSLEKVKQIEVLRGPASSLYGNVALTAVVNIITKSAREAEGLRLSAGWGNFGQKRVDVLYGKLFMNAEVVAWGSLFYADGQEVEVSAKRVIVEDNNGLYKRLSREYPRVGIVEGYKDLPSYDVGLRYRNSGFSFMLNARYGKRIDPFASVGAAQGASYTYRDYPKFRGEGVGYGMGNLHTEGNWSGRIGKWDLHAEIYFDRCSHNQYTTTGDSVNAAYQDVWGGGVKVIRDGFQLMNWQEYSWGGAFRAGWEYEWRGMGRGNLLAGLQGEEMNVYGANHFLGKDRQVWFYSQDLLNRGRESTFSAFSQLKHYFSEKWILNAGMRLDYKRRSRNYEVEQGGRKLRNIFACSPRVALVYLPGNAWNFKWSVARAFVDAPYFYRANRLPSFLPDTTMKPEYLTAVQFFYACRFGQSAWSYEGNLFYNFLTDFIWHDRQASGGVPRYMNAGELHLMGWENSVSYTMPLFRAGVNVSVLMVVSGTEGEYDFRGMRICNVPPLTATGWFSLKVKQWEDWEWWLDVDGNFSAPQLSPISNVVFLEYRDSEKRGEYERQLSNHTIDAYYVLNAGCRWQGKKWSVGVHGYNVTDCVYYQGGTTVVPYRQQGVSIMAKIGYRIGK